MTDTELERLEKLAKAAAPGPWKAAGVAFPIVLDSRARPICDGESYEMEDAEFIAAAREAVPALIAEVRRLRAQVDELEIGISEGHWRGG